MAQNQNQQNVESLDGLVSINQNSNYTYSDGFYYYNGVLSPSEQINLCDSLTFSSLIDNQFQDKNISLIFNIEAIQAENEAYKEIWSDAPYEWMEIIDSLSI